MFNSHYKGIHMKRIVSIFLALSLILSPLSIFANAPQTDKTEEGKEKEEHKKHHHNKKMEEEKESKEKEEKK